MLRLAAAIVVLLTAVPGAAAAERVPHELPAPASAAAATTWIVGARPGARASAVARAQGARALALPGVFTVPAGRARALAGALRAQGLLRFSERDVALTRTSAFEGGGREALWARGSVVAPGLSPPARPVPIGIVDDVVDTRVPDTAQARVLAASATRRVLDGHGTAVASVAAGRQDGAGVLGVLPGAPLLSYGLKTLTCGEVVDGILATTAAGARVVNLSLGTTDDCFALQRAIAEAFADDTLVVAAAGNEFADGNPVVFPAAYPHVLSVGAVDATLAPSYFSTSNAAVDVAAPGEGVPAALPAAFDDDGTPDGLGLLDGTSFAAPVVAGAAAWLMSARPGLAPGQYADLLRHSARDLGPPGWDPDTGAGLVDLAAALTAPTPALDRFEPNDGIAFADGQAIWQGGPPRALRASVDAVEDPVDVYRIRLGAGRRAVIGLTPSAGNADLVVYAGTARTLSAASLARSRGPAGRTDRVIVRNRARRARTYYVAVLAPDVTTRAFDAPYVLRVAG